MTRRRKRPETVAEMREALGFPEEGMDFEEAVAALVGGPKPRREEEGSDE